jgi:hypothetical protein
VRDGPLTGTLERRRERVSASHAMRRESPSEGTLTSARQEPHSAGIPISAYQPAARIAPARTETEEESRATSL